ncbi:MAG TPA: hypothetical protein VJ124_24615 [Pyrinomonadaceae bacterium]|nr:hypothetical protein [Pyrinomonadaceae bacterium]
MRATSSPNELHITIGVYPAKDANLRQDIKLIKAALLYADRVTIYSPSAALLQIATRLGDLSETEQLRFLEMVAPYVASSSDAAKIVDGLRKLRDPRFSQSPQGRLIKSALLKQFASSWEEIRRVVNNLAETAGMREVVEALSSGMLEIHQFATQTNNSDVMQFMVDCVAKASGKQLSAQQAASISHRQNEMTKEFVAGICSAVASSSTYPLFDKDTGQLVSLAQKVVNAPTSSTSQQRARHIAFASDMFRRLHVFDSASIRDVLLVRGELDKHLVRFRKSVIEFASDVASSPWDDDFEKETELLFRKEIAPAILDLEDEIKSNNFLGQLARKAVDRPLVLTPGATLSLVLSQLTSLPDEIAGGFGIGISAAALVYDAYKEGSEKQRAIERNGLYFYYRVDRKLEGLS